MKTLFRIISSLIVPTIFIILGVYLIKKGNIFFSIVGYANIIFWLIIIFVSSHKLITKKQ